MTAELSIFAARVREHIDLWADEFSGADEMNDPARRQHADAEFNGLAVMLFTLQFKHNAFYRRMSEACGVSPAEVTHWSQIPIVPTAAFKEFSITSLAFADRIREFRSSGTTQQRPSRHFHSAESLALYETSLNSWWRRNVHLPVQSRVLSLTPPPQDCPHSSLVHMFDQIRQRFGAGEECFVGQVQPDGSWTIEINRALDVLATLNAPPLLILGTAFSFVHLLDAVAERGIKYQLASESKVLETGGYKGRSRVLPKAELHQLITAKLGVSQENIICEYGMSELSSQAYEITSSKSERIFRFPPWARARVISPETAREVGEGETGLLQVFDLANVFSVMAIQTEDLAVRRGDGFELIGRAALAEARGCSLMTV